VIIADVVGVCKGELHGLDSAGHPDLFMPVPILIRIENQKSNLNLFARISRSRSPAFL
jgi:hypothetical protein